MGFIVALTQALLHRSNLNNMGTICKAEDMANRERAAPPRLATLFFDGVMSRFGINHHTISVEVANHDATSHDNANNHKDDVRECSLVLCTQPPEREREREGNQQF